MTATPDCQPWCTDHQKSGNECLTRYSIFDDGNEVQQAPPPPGSIASMFEYPKDVSWIQFIASQDEEDDSPVMDLHFFEAGALEPIVRLTLDVDVLRELHSKIGAIIKDFT